MKIVTKAIIMLNDEEKNAVNAVKSLLKQYCSQYTCVTCPFYMEFGSCPCAYFNNIEHTFMPEDIIND